MLWEATSVNNCLVSTNCLHCNAQFVYIGMFQVSLYTLEENQVLCFKVETYVNIAADQTFHLLADLRRRQEWDRHYE